MFLSESKNNQKSIWEVSEEYFCFVRLIWFDAAFIYWASDNTHTNNKVFYTDSLIYQQLTNN